MATVVSDPFFSFRGQRNSSSGWFNMPFINYSNNTLNNAGGGFLATIGNDVYFIPNGATSSYNPCSNTSYRVIWNSSNLQDNVNLIGQPVNQILPDLPNTTDNFILAFPADVVGTYKYVKVNKPTFLPADVSCVVLTYSTAYPVYEYEQSDSTGGGSTDITPLIPAILMIPATLIVLGMFSIIYRMFINRRVRG